jgi:hypothetical protein
LTRVSRMSVPLGVVAGCAAVGAAVNSYSAARVMFSVSVAGVLVAVALRAPQRAFKGLVVWLAALGMIRRVLSGVDGLGGITPVGDPLLLVETMVMVILGSIAVAQGALRRASRLTAAVLLLMGLLVASAANPDQGGLQVGIGGVVLIVVPMVAFFIGRAHGTQRLVLSVLRLIAILSIPAALYGLYQTFVGFPDWDRAWIQSSGYTALSVYGVIRGFSSFASSAEYGTFLAVGLMGWIGLGSRMGRVPVRVAAGVLVGAGIFYQSSRGILVGAVVALIVMEMAKRGARARLAATAAALVLITTPYIVGSFAPTSHSVGGTSSALAQHQFDGLGDPLGEESTLPGHVTRLVDGLLQGFRSPIGIGVGAITIAASKYGSANASSEVDPSNAGIAAGIPGLILYAVIVVCSFRIAYRQARMNGAGSCWPTVLGVLLVLAFQWLNGGQYSVAILPWFLIGSLDRRPAHETEPDPAAPVVKAETLTHAPS